MTILQCDKAGPVLNCTLTTLGGVLGYCSVVSSAATNGSWSGLVTLQERRLI